MAPFIARLTRGIGVGVIVGAVSLAGAVGASAAAGPARAQPQSRAVAAAATAKVPAGFRANSITWVSPERGWVLGSVPCASPASGAPPTPGCAEVIGTTNGGKTWSLTGKVGTYLVQDAQPAASDVSEIRFANSKVGWAFGPALFRTTNGGRSWTKVALPRGGKQVVSLAASGSGGFLAVTPCANGSGAADCNQKGYTFWRTATLTGAWKRIALTTALAAQTFDNGADVAVYGKTVYALWSAANSLFTVFHDKLYASTNGGVSFTARPDPCVGLALTQAVPVSKSAVDLLCSNATGGGQTSKAVYRSADTGKKDTSAGVPPGGGDTPELAASPTGNLAVSAAFAASYIFVNDTGKTTWTQVVNETDGGLGWNDIVYVSDREAWIVHEPAQDACSCAVGQVFVTRDGGQHWTLAQL
jgi:hypothetical protein